MPLGWGCDLPARPDVETVITRLPDRIAVRNPRPVVQESRPVRFLDLPGRLLLPLVHKRAQLPNLRTPDQRMNVVRHDDKPCAQAVLPSHAAAKLPDDNSLCPARLQEGPSPVARKRDEVDVLLVIVDPSFDHGLSSRTSGPTDPHDQSSCASGTRPGAAGPPCVVCGTCGLHSCAT